MRYISAVLLIVAASAISFGGLIGCDTAPPTTTPTIQATNLPVNDDQLPLVNGQPPPLATPPDSIVQKAQRILGGLTPQHYIANVWCGTICNVANSWCGVRYVYGGNSRSGVDCSHLVYQVYRGAGISSYPYMTTSQMRAARSLVSVPWCNDGGDIVLFWNLGHTGIYMGNGWMINANSYYGRVMWDNLNTPYWQSFYPFLVRYVRW